MFASCKGKRLVGRPNFTTICSFLHNIGKMILSIYGNRSFNSYIYLAYNELIWAQLINNLKSIFYAVTPK